MKTRILTAAILFGLVCPNSAVFVSDPPFYHQLYAEIPLARSIIVDEVGDILVSTMVTEPNLYFVYDEPDSLVNGSVQVVQGVLVDGTGLNLNHGIAYSSGYLYASSSQTVYRWPYTPGQRRPVDNSSIEIVISDIPDEGGPHITRSILFDTAGLLYVHIGSYGDVDLDSTRARILRFNISNLPSGGINFEDGEVFALGLRNSVGLGFDANGVLWGVDNGITIPNREDLGGDLSFDNPAEELNRIDGPIGSHYGYPYCFSSYLIQNYTANTQFVDNNFMTNESIYTDDWCQNINNNKPPVLAMPAHTAPLGIQFYDKSDVCSRTEGSFPCEALGDAFIAFHATELSDNPTFHGYKVSLLPFNSETGEPTGELISVIYDQDLVNGDCSNGACRQPVNAVFDNKGHLIVSSDLTSELYRVTYGTPPLPISSRKFLY